MTHPDGGGSQSLTVLDPLASRTGLPLPSNPAHHVWPRDERYVVPLASFAGAFLGCMATLYLTTSGLPPPIASALATLSLCAGLIIAPTRSLESTTFSSAVYGGSFSGMTPAGILIESVTRAGLPEGASFFLLSAFCGLLFCIMTIAEVRLRVGLPQGYGGQLGVLAAIASLLFLYLMLMLGDGDEALRLAHLNHLDKDLKGSLAIFASCMAGTALTLVMLRLPAVAGAGRTVRIFVSAVVAIAGMAILTGLLPDERCLIDAYYAGCFLGMSSPQRLSGRLAPIVAAATLTVLLVQASTVLPLVGGSLGLVAFSTMAGLDMLSWMVLGRDPSQHGVAALVLRNLILAAALAVLLLPTDLFLEETDLDPKASVAQQAPRLPPATPPTDRLRDETDLGATGSIAQQTPRASPATPPDAPSPAVTSPVSAAASGPAGDVAAAAAPKPPIAAVAEQPTRGGPQAAKPRQRAPAAAKGAPPKIPVEPAQRRITRAVHSAKPVPAGRAGANPSAGAQPAPIRRASARPPTAAARQASPREAQPPDTDVEPYTTVPR